MKIKRDKVYNDFIQDNTLVLDDCFNVFPYIKDQSVNLILADLPFGTTKCDWDKILPLDLLWPEYKRILKPNGAILLYAQTPFDKVLGASNLKMLKYEWIWEKTSATGFQNANLMPMKAHENILVFYNKLPTYNPQKTQGHTPVNSFTKKKEIADKSNVYGKNTKDISGGGNTDRYPRSVLRLPSDKQKNKLDGTLYDTQKPYVLNEYFIKTYTNPGDLVFTNVAGSGSEILPCVDLGRRFIGIEKEERGFEIMIKRFNKYGNKN